MTIKNINDFIRPLPTINDYVKPLPTVKDSLRPLPTLDNPVQVRPATSDYKVFNYDDPNEMNSFADLFYKTLKRVGSTEAIDAAFGWSIPEQEGSFYSDLRQLVYEGKIRPLVEGELGIFFNNVIIGFGETMDLLAAPVKGAFLGEGTLSERIKSATVGRVNYDYDTGSWVSNMILEVLSDPTTLISLGASSLGKSLLKESVQEIAPELVEKEVRRIARSMFDSYDGKDWMKHVRDYINGASKDANILLKNIDNVENALKSLQLNSMTIQLARNIRKTSDKVDFGLLRMSLGTGNGLLFAGKYLGVKKVAVNILQSSMNRGEVYKESYIMIDLIENLGDLKVQYDTLQQILEGGEKLSPNYIQGIVQHVLKNEEKQLVTLYRKYVSKTEMNKIIEIVKEKIKIGQYPDVDIPIEYQAYRYAMDEMTKELTHGQIKKFEDYLALVKKLEENDLLNDVSYNLQELLRTIQHNYNQIIRANNHLKQVKVMETNMRELIDIKRVQAEQQITEEEFEYFKAFLKLHNPEKEKQLLEYLKTYAKENKSSSTVRYLQKIINGIQGTGAVDLNQLLKNNFPKYSSIELDTDLKQINLSKFFKTDFLNNLIRNKVLTKEQAENLQMLYYDLKDYFELFPEEKLIQNSYKWYPLYMELQEEYIAAMIRMYKKDYKLIFNWGSSVEKPIEEVAVYEKLLRIFTQDLPNDGSTVYYDLLTQLHKYIESEYVPTLDEIERFYTDLLKYQEGIKELSPVADTAVKNIDGVIKTYGVRNNEVTEKILDFIRTLNKERISILFEENPEEIIVHFKNLIDSIQEDKFMPGGLWKAVKELHLISNSHAKNVDYTISKIINNITTENLEAALKEFFNGLKQYPTTKESSQVFYENYLKVMNEFERTQDNFQRAYTATSDWIDLDSEKAYEYGTYAVWPEAIKDKTILIKISEASQALDDFIQKFTAFEVLDVTEESVYYRLKHTQVYNLMELLNLKKLTTLRQDFADPDSLTRNFLIELTQHPDKSYQNLAYDLLHKIEGIESSVALFDEILNKSVVKPDGTLAQLDSEWAIALMDTLNTFARNSYMKMKTDVVMWENLILRKMEEQHTYKVTDRLFNLEAGAEVVFEKMSDVELAKFKSNYGKYAHNANTDVAVNKELIKYLHDVKGSYMKMTPKAWIVDIETTGLKGSADHILQQSYMDVDDNVICMLPKLLDDDIEPDDSVLRTLFKEHEVDGDIVPYTRKERLDLFKKIFKDQDLETIQRIYGGDRVSIQIFESEEDMLRAFKEQLTQAGISEVYGHNFYRFDSGFINRRLESYGMERLNLRIRDTLREWQRVENVKVLTLYEQEHVRSIVKRHLARRYNEPSTILRRSGDTVIKDLAEFNREFDQLQFIETPDQKFLEDLDQLETIIESISHNSVEGTQISTDLTRTLNEARAEILTTLQTMAKDNRTLNKYFLNKTDIARINMALELNLNDLPPEELLNASKLKNDTNITALLSKPTILDGHVVAYQELGVSKALDAEIVSTYFNIPNINKLPKSMVLSIGTASKNIDNISKRITNVDVLRTLNINEVVVKNSIEIIIKEIKHYNTNSSLNTMLQMLRINEIKDIRRLVAISVYLEHYGAHLAEGAKNLEEYLNIIRTTPMAKTRLGTHIFEFNNELKAAPFRFEPLEGPANALYHTLDIDDPEIKRVYDLWTEYEESKPFTFENFKELLYNYKVVTPGMEANAQMLYQSMKPIIIMQSILKRIERGDFPKLGIDSAKAAAAVAARAKLPFERFRLLLSDTQINYVFNLNREDFLSYMAHYSKGTIILDSKGHAELLSVFEKRVLLPDEPLIEISRVKRKIIYTFKKDGDLSQIRYKAFKVDVDLSDVQIITDVTEDPIINSEIKRAFDSYMVARKKMLDYDKNSALSGMEIVNPKVLSHVYSKLPSDIANKSKSIDELINAGLFEGVNYNHSILGNTDMVSEYLPKASRNPVKNTYQASQWLSRIISNQDKIRFTLFDQTVYGIRNYWDSRNADKMNDQELIQLISDPNSGIRLAWIAKDKDIGYKVKSVYVKSSKDLAFAYKVDAVLMTEDSYRQAISIINNVRINNKAIELFDHYAVMPLKLGYLMSTGFILRNLIDSNLKNIITTGTFGIAPHTIEVTRQYMNYKKAIQDLIALGGITTKNINDYFDTGTRKIAQETFTMFHDLLNSGVGSLTRELEEHFGDVYNVLHRRIRKDTGLQELITAQDIKTYINEHPAAMEALFEQKYPDAADRVLAELDRLKYEFKYYKDAYAMTKHTNNPELTLERLVSYLKNSNKIPLEHLEEFNKLLRFKYEETINDKIFNNIRNNSLIQGFFDINSDLENVVRLSHYTYQMKYGSRKAYEAFQSTINTHFDYSTKNKAQLYGEIVFPFMTFATNNTLYWLRVLQTNPRTATVLRDYIMQQSGVQDSDEWDVTHRMTLQYQMQTENIILDKESGLTLKINPSIMDAFNLLLTPIVRNKESGEFEGEIVSRLNAYIKTPIQSLLGDKPEWQTKEEYDKAQFWKWLNLIPFFGATANRFVSGQKNAEKTNNLLPKIAPSLFGRVSYPQPEKPYRPYPYQKYPEYTHYKPSYYNRYPTRSYFSLAPYHSVKNARYGYNFDYIMPEQVVRFNKIRQEYRDAAYTRSGKNKLELMLIPTNSQNIHWKMALIART